jgi:hypothetical protein
VNFQRVPMVDTSNPFISRDIPSADESMVVIRFANPKGIDFQYLLNMINDSFMSRANTIVVPGGKMELAMQLIFTPFIWRMMERASANVRTGLPDPPLQGATPAVTKPVLTPTNPPPLNSPPDGQCHPHAGGGRGRASQVRPPRRAHGHGRHCRGAVEPPPQHNPRDPHWPTATALC